MRSERERRQRSEEIRRRRRVLRRWGWISEEEKGRERNISLTRESGTGCRRMNSRIQVLARSSAGGWVVGKERGCRRRVGYGKEEEDGAVI